MNISIEHVAISSPDPVGLRDWYERVLGARTIFDSRQKPPAFLIALPGGGQFEIYAADGKPQHGANKKLAGFGHIALRVESLDAARMELEERGVKFPEAERPAAGGGRALFFEDCDGNLLHLVERPGGSDR